MHCFGSDVSGSEKFGLKLSGGQFLLIAVTTGIFGMLLLVDQAGGAKLTVIFYWRGIFAGGNTEALRGSIHCENP